MLVICTWGWGGKYGRDDVAKLSAGVRRHLAQAHRFLLVTEWGDLGLPGVQRVPIKDVELTRFKGCFARLRMFDPAWQAECSIVAGDRIVCIDLDVVVTGPLDPLFNRPESFVILQGANASNPCPYNGSLWMLRAGYRPDVWSEFTVEGARLVPHYEFPDDQGWFAHKLPKAAGWRAGSPSGVYAFQKPGWPKGDALPKGARLVVFPGWRSPSLFTALPWVKEHWRA